MKQIPIFFLKPVKIKLRDIVDLIPQMKKIKIKNIFEILKIVRFELFFNLVENKILRH